MRLGLVIYDSLETVSGGYLYDRMLVDYLRGQGEQVEIISLPWRNYSRHLGDNLSPGLFRRLRQAQVDILLQDELNHPSLFWLNRILKASHSKTTASRSPVAAVQHPPAHPLANIPIISIVHHLRSSENHPRWLNLLYRRVESWYLSSVDGFIFNSQTTRRVVQALAGDSQPAIVALPAGDKLKPELTESEILARARQEGALRLIFVGNLIRRKGLHHLLSALSQTPRGAINLTVVGRSDLDPAYARQIQHLVARYDLAAHVRFLGQQTEAELGVLLRSHHVLVVPSSYEGFGIVYLEGMGFGLPAIGPSAGGAAEIITQDVNGFLINPDAPAHLSRLLTCLHQDRGRLAEMSLAARQRYLSHPTWEQTGSQIHTFLKSLATKTWMDTHESTP